MRHLSKPPTLSLGVIVPATGEAPHLDRCLLSIAAADDGPDELTIVDQPGLSVVAARNDGVRRSRADVLVFVDSDVLVHPDAFARIRLAFGQDPQLSALIGTYDDRPSAGNAISGFRNLLHHHIYASAAGPVAIFWTGLGAVRRTAFDSAGGFDDRLRWPRRSSDRRDFMADVAFGFRLADAGHRILLDPNIQGTHVKRWTLPQMVYTDFLLRGVPWIRLALRRGSAPAHLNLGWRHRMSALASLLGVLSLLRRQASLSAAVAASMVALNLAFYRLLVRRRGPRQAAIGFLLHMIHHLTSLASLLAGIVIHVAERGQSSLATEPSTLPAAPSAGGTPSATSPPQFAGVRPG